MLQQPLPQEQSKAIRAEIDRTYLDLVDASRKFKLVCQLGFGWKIGVFYGFYSCFYKFILLTRFENANLSALYSRFKRKNGHLLIDDIDAFFKMPDAKKSGTLGLELSEEYMAAMYDLGVVSYQ